MPEEGRKRRMEEVNERKVGFEFGCDGSVEVDEVQKWSSQCRHAFVLEIWFSTRFFGTFLRCFSIKIILKSWGAVVSGPIYSELLVSASYNAWTVVVMVADWLT